mmetsp:Transcript_16396/g.37601  ORF Transcript_16396/g.37601 Transcript_16396/m.37601 type:complete len:759 (+) Transcript_16396:217-2493(+)
MFYSQVILAKKGPLAKVWLAAHWGDKKLARPQIFATDISQSCTDIMNPSVPLALRLSGHLLLGVVRIYSRKVKYVLNDCTEAMLKLQMAFAGQSSSSAGPGGLLVQDASGRELLAERDAPAHQLVANFGEYDRVHVVEGFCLPLPEDNEWILADETTTMAMATGTGDDEQQAGLYLAANLPTSTQQETSLSSKLASMESPGGDEEEEAWAPFDPDNEEDDDDEREGLEEGLEANDNEAVNQSQVSDIEIVRAANDSILSEDRTRRSTSLLGEADKSTLTADPSVTGPPREEDGGDGYDFAVAFGDDESEDPGAAVPGTSSPGLGDSALELSRDSGATPLGDTTGLALNTNDDDDDEISRASGSKRVLAATTSATSPKPPPRKRRRKRRKVVIDNHATELTNDHIRAMLRDTDDIVRPMPHPASVWDDELPAEASSSGRDYKALVLEQRRAREREEGGSSRNKSKHPAGKKGAPGESLPILTRPFLADGNGPPLHPVLEKLWRDNYWKSLGEPCPYQRSSAGGAAEEVEQTRGAAAAPNDDDESTLGEASDPGAGGGRNQASTGEPLPISPEDAEGFGLFPTATDDENEDEEDAPATGFDDEERGVSALESGERGEDLLELGMVNDMILDSDDDEDLERDGNDDEEEGHGAVSGGGVGASSSTKWHKHTVRVFRHLKKCLRDPDDGSSNDDENTTGHLPEAVNFHELTRHVTSRRNASSVFFEMLQLKTWDFIELDQDESYGDIAISAGLRFGEEAPAG